ncbi:MULTISPECIES: alanine racemase [unclassified Frondihabitans]|uniref:alanine racemase n=1 Tax=unclassified Frondihabitans TaxID=2626248 RepID=UPI000F9D0876|nr:MULTISPECIES: alanine racemase [unclassified Frondihabitans]RPE77365.1 D-serine deaminase-like pyridoxal phosphate-dependent protein [Frondihabitans sp. PhB153]RPF07641.1 D-serine deaminase-like pyridoxal phosphate-dependent protein [Frondihabitans sp. PhB161]
MTPRTDPSATLPSSSKVAFTPRPWPIPLDELPTPVLTIDTAVLDHNIDTMARWCSEAGVDLAPHGKTTMAPEVWQRQLDAGAWGITVATAYQAEIARRAGVRNIVFAGTTFSTDALLLLVEPGSDVLMWVDSVSTVHLVDAALDRGGAIRPLPVLVELGARGGRTGARTLDAALAVAAAVRDADHLVLAGVAGYEGALTHGIDAESLQLVDDYLATLIEFRDRLDGESFTQWLDLGGDVVLTAGGSVYFDRVVEALGFRHDPDGVRGVRTRVVLRSGAYVTHDHDLYRRLTPFERIENADRFLPALDLWASVISKPEATLALLNVGRRDTADDEGLPILIEAYRTSAQGVRRVPGAVEAARVTGLNDQHAFVELPPESSLAIGDLVRLGISHPCTTIDKWTDIATIDEGRGQPRALPAVSGVIRTRF